jgi:hypothetical protein
MLVLSNSSLKNANDAAGFDSFTDPITFIPAFSAAFFVSSI